MTHIEFFGLPGSGKSTIKVHLIKELTNRNDKVFSEEDALFNIFKKSKIKHSYLLKYFPDKYSKKILKPIFNRSKIKFDSIIRFFAIHVDLIQTIFKSDSFNQIHIQEKERILSWFFNTISIYQIIEDNVQNNSTIVFDEGFIHKILNFFISPSHLDSNDINDDIINYIGCIPKPDYLIYVDSNIDDCYKRMKTRGFPSRLKSRNDAEIKTYLQFCQKQMDFVINHLKDNNFNVIKVNNFQSIENAIKSLPELIKQI